MGTEDPTKGISIKSQEASAIPVYDREFAKALTFLGQYHNEAPGNLLKELTEEARNSPYNELGGSWSDILGTSANIEQAKAALADYTANMLTDDEKRFAPTEMVDRKRKAEKMLLRYLKQV